MSTINSSDAARGNGAKVIVVDDHELFRRGLIGLLEERGIEIIGEAALAADAIRQAADVGPCVVLMDLSMPGIDGFGAISAIVTANARPRVVVLSGSADPGDIEKARASGAFGYLMKDRIADELVPGVLAAAAG